MGVPPRAEIATADQAKYFLDMGVRHFSVGTAMTTNRTSYVFVGLAGETAPGRPTKSGLYRMAVGDDTWALATRGLPDAPTIRAIATHPEHPEIVFAGTQNGPYRSTDAGE